MKIPATISSDIAFLLLITTGGLLLGSVLPAPDELVNGTISGKLLLIHPAVLCFSFSVLLVVLMKRAQVTCIFQPADLFVYLLGIIFFATYRQDTAPSPERLALLGQMLIFWFALRFSFGMFSRLSRAFIVVLILTGMAEAVWGLAQLYGLQISNHSLFRLTGSFHNPGPFSGYLAVMLPLTLGALFNVQKGGSTGLRRDILTYGILIACCLMLVVLPPAMSRSAWMAAGISCAWLTWQELAPAQWFRNLSGRYRKMVGISLVVSVVLFGAAFGGMYFLKKDSADGRLLIWKMSWRAIKEQPLGGTGIGGFPKAYATAQFDYFASGNYTKGDEYLAGSPEYAFNEPMQLWLETGLLGLAVFTALLLYCFYAGIRNRRYGTCAALLALVVFSLTSYPFQMPSFMVLLIFFLVDCLRGPFVPPVIMAYRPGMIVVICLLLVFSSTVLWKSQQPRFDAYRQWNGLQMLYQAGAWENAVGKYDVLEPELGHLPEFLFEYAQCLRKSGRYNESNGVLERASLLSSDPMIRNLRGRNHQAMGNYKKAESLYLEAMFLQPARIYPYYLLSKLYAEKQFNHPENLKIVAERALSMEPKVNNTAVDEMRKELIELLKNENLLQL